MRLSEVPAWFWVTLASLLAVGGVTAGLLRSGLRSGAWRWRYQPGHRARPSLAVELPATLALVPRAVVAGSPPWEVAHEPTAAEVAASRAAHGYIPELDPDADDLGPGAGFLLFPVTTATCSSDDEGAPKVDSPAPAFDLGPRACAVLERYELLFQQKWARRLVPA